MSPNGSSTVTNGASPDSAIAATVFAGDGEMAQRCRDFDWGSTPLGPVESWSHSLRSIVGTLLMSRHPMFLWWGPELVQIYNDAYRPSFGSGGRHPRALGAKGKEFWTDIWDTIGPQIDMVMSGRGATWHEDQHLPIERNGRLEDVWWTYGYSPVRDDDGSIGGTLVVCQETTTRVLGEARLKTLLAELKVSKNRLADVFRLAPSFLAVITGPELVFELVNDAYYQLVGHRDIIGKPLLEALPEIRGQGYDRIVKEVVATGKAFVGRALPVKLARTPDAPQEERFVDLIYQPLVDEHGHATGIIAHGTDVTEQVRAQRNVERLLTVSELARADAEAARAEAEAANRAKSEFLAIMSHELRTPLNAIAGYAQLLEMEVRGPITEQQRADLTRIQTSQRHLLGLINEVLNYAKLETGSVRYELDDVPVHSALAAAEELVAPQARSRGLELTVGDCPPDLAMRADPEKLRQILVNLLSNAIKFTDRGGRIALVCEDEHDAEEPTVSITVSDTGIGIPREKLAAIFEPFVQVRADLTRTADGTGLGLAISRDLAEGMGGSLTVESEKGVGSSFRLTLPAARR
ncbi:MAG: ATP-binding protein [Gemmatimonadaceae bacterium]